MRVGVSMKVVDQETGQDLDPSGQASAPFLSRWRHAQANPQTSKQKLRASHAPPTSHPCPAHISPLPRPQEMQRATRTGPRGQESEEPPELYSIHKGAVTGVQSYGIFVKVREGASAVVGEVAVLSAMQLAANRPQPPLAQPRLPSPYPLAIPLSPCRSPASGGTCWSIRTRSPNTCSSPRRTRSRWGSLGGEGLRPKGSGRRAQAEGLRPKGS